MTVTCLDYIGWDFYEENAGHKFEHLLLTSFIVSGEKVALQ